MRVVVSGNQDTPLFIGFDSSNNVSEAETISRPFRSVLEFMKADFCARLSEQLLNQQFCFFLAFTAMITRTKRTQLLQTVIRPPLIKPRRLHGWWRRSG